MAPTLFSIDVCVFMRIKYPFNYNVLLLARDLKDLLRNT